MELSPPKSKCVLSEGRSLYSCIHTRTGALLKERRTGENGAGSAQKVCLTQVLPIAFNTSEQDCYSVGDFYTILPPLLRSLRRELCISLGQIRAWSWRDSPVTHNLPIHPFYCRLLSSAVIMFHWANLDVLGRVNLEVVFLTNGGELFIALYGLIYL